jgi:uncharacterized protein YndB with AHSA1/START domain
MLKIVGIVALVLLVAVAAVLIYAATKPDTFRIQRAMSVNAPPEKVFALINDFRRWTVWSPWEKMDPALQRTYSGTASGQGAVYAWEGNRKVGAGRMEITDAPSPSKVTIKLDFLRPFEAHNIAEFTLEPKGDATTVTWAMHGPNLFVGKVMSIFVDMDRMIGKDFETGLANLKAAAEQ